MEKLLGCTVTAELYAAWSQLLVADPEPLMLTEDARALLPADTLVLTEREFFDNYPIAPLEMRDSYHLYGLKSEVAGVALLSAAELRRLPPGARTALHRVQWELGRGQIYDELFVREVLAEFPAQIACFEPHFFTVSGGGQKVALSYDLWHALPEEAQRRWLGRVVAEEGTDCRSGTFSAADWAQVTDQHGPAVRALAGSFADRSGPNCFALALAAVTPSPAQALTIAGLWLHQAPFLRGLAKRGFSPHPLAPAPDATAVPPGVLVWSNTAGLPQHACYVLGAGLALNKQAQGWHAPRQILPLQMVLDSWQEDDLSLSLYVR